MFQIQIGNQLKQLPFTTTCVEDILDYIKNFVDEDNIKHFVFVYNNIPFNIDTNISLIDIGYSPYQLIEVKILKPKIIIFNLNFYKYQYNITIKSNYTCYDTQTFFAQQYYTIPQNIIIKYQNEIVKDDAFLYFITKDKDNNFEISVKNGYHLYYTYFKNFKFICMKDDSKLIDLKITLGAYNNLSADNIIYGDTINDYFQETDQKTIDNSELISLFDKITIFDFTFQENIHKNKPFNVDVKIETMKGPIIDHYNMIANRNVYYIKCLCEKRYGIERSLFKVYSRDRLLDLYEIVGPNTNNDLVIKMEKDDEILKIKIRGKLNRITSFTNINDMKLIDKFEDHNFGIVVNKHFILDETGNTLLLKYLNNTKDDNNATQVTLLKPQKSCHMRTFSELSAEGKIVKKARFIIPDEMKMEQISTVYLHRNFDSIKLLKSNNFEVEFTESNGRTIEYIFISQLDSLKAGSVTINGANSRAMDLVAQIYKDFKSTFKLKKNKYDMFEVYLNKDRIDFWTKLTDIFYDKENIIKIKGLFYQNDKQQKEKTINIINIEKGNRIEIPYEILTAEEIINKIDKNRKEKVKLFMDYNELNPTDIPTIYKSNLNCLFYNVIPQRKAFTISNGTPLKFKINENELNFPHIASTINSIFRLDENQTSFYYTFKKKNLMLPRKFNAGSLPNDAEIKIHYSYEKLNTILFKFENEKIRMKINVDQSVEKIKSYIQQKLNIWDFSLNSISLVFYNFKFPRFAPFSAFKIPFSTIIKIETSETYCPIFISTSENLLNKKYKFSEGETIKNVKNHLKRQFDIDYDIDLRSEKDEKLTDNLKITKNMKIICFCKQIPIKCEGSLGDDEIMISEIVSIEEAISYLRTKLNEDDVSIFTYNLKGKHFEKTDLKKNLIEFKEPLFAHKIMPDITILNYPFTILKTERISELNTIEFLKENYIAKTIQSLPQNFELTQNLREIDASKTLDNFIDSPMNISFAVKKEVQTEPKKSKRMKIPKVKIIPISDDQPSSQTPSISIKVPLIKKNKITTNSSSSDDEDKLFECTFKIGKENTFSLSFSSKSTIFDVKKKIAQEQGLGDPSDVHPFIFDTFPGDEKTIKSINPQNEDVFQVFIRPSFIGHDENDEIKILDTEFANIIYLQLRKPLGEGGQGLVYRIKNFENDVIKNEDEFWAVKVFKSNGENNNEKSFKRFVNEYKVLNILNHPNIVKTYGFYYGNENYDPCILLEYCPNDLKTIKNELSKIDLVGIIYEIAYAMKYVHSANLIHRDLKPSNILLDENNHVKICDFGLATLIDFNEEIMKSRSCDTVTMNYVAPEVLCNENYNEKVDVYSFGLILYSLLQKDLPDPISRIKTKRVEIPKNANSFMSFLMMKCLSADSNDRPSFSKIEEMIIQNDFLLFDGIEDGISSLKIKLGLAPIIEKDE